MTFAGLVLSPVYGLARQVEAEAERQREWRMVCAISGEPPEQAPRCGELVCGEAACVGGGL